MSVSSVTSSSAYAQWRASMRSPTSATNASAKQGFTALFQGTQATAPPIQRAPRLSDDQAAQIGARIQSNNPAAFKLMDANADGSLTAKELKDGLDRMAAAQAEQFGQQLSQSNPALFKALDTNGDSTLGARELQAARDQLSMGAPPLTGSQGHRHHHRSGQQEAAGEGSDPLARLLDSSPSSTGQADLQTNTLNDLLQRLLTSTTNS